MPELQRFALQRAPLFGSVVLIQIEPVAAPPTVVGFSKRLNDGTDVCGLCCSAGHRYVPTVTPTEDQVSELEK